MAEINLLDLYPKAKRNLESRANSASDQDRLLARQFGLEYFDGTRNQGYGGYRYDGRWKPVVKRFASHYGLKPGSRVLDVGSAKGFMLYDFMTELEGIEVAGIDISQYAFDHALPDTKPFLKVGNATALPYDDQSFDLVISINTIHNLALPELKQSLREIERVSKRHSFITVDAYHDETERARMLQWNLTALTHMYVPEWVKLFDEVGYTGDYFWFIP